MLSTIVLFASPGLFILLVIIALVVTTKRAHALPKTHGDYLPCPVPSEVSERAAESLSQVLRCPTVSVKPTESYPDYTAFTTQRHVLEERYPLVFAKMQLTTVAEHSFVLHWHGKNSDKLPLLFCAHLDVVPAGEDWTYDPFGGERANGNIYGRGAIDIKNLLCCLLEAAELQLADGITPEQDIYFAFGHDEEIGGKEGAAAIAGYFTEQNIEFDIVLDEGGFIYQTGDNPPIAQIAVAEKGIMNLTITARDAGGHASIPTAKHSALGRLSEALVRLEANQMPAKFTPLTTAYFTKIAGTLTKKQRYYLANRKLFKRRALKIFTQLPAHNAMMRTTAVATVAQSGDALNVLPKMAIGHVNVRLLTGTSSDEYIAFAKALISDLDVEITAAKQKEPGIVSEYGDDAFNSLASTIRDVYGNIIVAPYLMVASTDAAYYEPLSRHVYRFCPFVIDRAQHATMHAADEFVQEESLGRAVLFYRKLMG